MVKTQPAYRKVTKRIGFNYYNFMAPITTGPITAAPAGYRPPYSTVDIQGASCSSLNQMVARLQQDKNQGLVITQQDNMVWSQLFNLANNRYNSECVVKPTAPAATTTPVSSTSTGPIKVSLPTIVSSPKTPIQTVLPTIQLPVTVTPLPSIPTETVVAPVAAPTSDPTAPVPLVDSTKGTASNPLYVAGAVDTGGGGGAAGGGGGGDATQAPTAATKNYKWLWWTLCIGAIGISLFNTAAE